MAGVFDLELNEATVEQDEASDEEPFEDADDRIQVLQTRKCVLCESS